MCEFCSQHGEGKKWYLNVKNYGTDLLDNLERKEMIKNTYFEIMRKGNKDVNRLEKMFVRNPKVIARMAPAYTKRMKSFHFGQVLPLEHIHEIVSLANSIVRIACGCRWEVEKKESRYCYGISFGPPDWYDEIDMDFFGVPDIARFEHMEKENALKCIDETDAKGLVHSIWTFQTPFIGMICNCDISYCLSMRTTVGMNMQSMFKAEVVAETDPDKCNGCKACIDACQFSAIDYRDEQDNCRIDPAKCYGCGVCRSRCTQDAISMRDRSTHPVASVLW
ncbi:MAG: 4Fe-4S binding protein [Spirochaetales bacterium]|nr:4Fe-4S binding protein [Spirochaetales bacterium]